LDTLFASGALPRADYIKLDCEWFEPEVLRGARHYLAASGPVCITSESGFNPMPMFPCGHLQAINELLAEHRLVVRDINVVRVARESYRRARAATPLPEPDPMADVPDLDVGPPEVLDVVFCRDFVAERATPDRYRFQGVPEGPPTVDQLIKAMVNFELHGLMDCAFEILTAFRRELEGRLDVGKAADLLLMKPPHPRNTTDMVNCLKMVATLRTQVLAQEQRIAELEAGARDAQNRLAAFDTASGLTRALIGRLRGRRRNA
jgi:hypothetical protein